MKTWVTSLQNTFSESAHDHTFASSIIFNQSMSSFEESKELILRIDYILYFDTVIDFDMVFCNVTM